MFWNIRVRQKVSRLRTEKKKKRKTFVLYKNKKKIIPLHIFHLKVVYMFFPSENSFFI